MANYLLRVQLSIGTDAYYTAQRDRLINIGFTKRIKDKAGIEWRLPNGNYYIQTESDLDTVMIAVRKVVATVDKQPMVVLVEVPKGQMTWYGLQKC
jgi:hypothetical protein